jgi:hypothetical protein
MKHRLFVLMLVAAAVAAVGGGYASSRGSQEPARPPDPAAEEIYVAGPDGGPLKCAGRLVKVRRSELGGSRPSLTPEQAAERLRQSPGAFLDVTSVRMFACVEDAFGRETGEVTTRVVPTGG